LFVADRGNVRFQIFDLDGKFLSEFKQFNRVSGFYIDRNDKLYAIDTDSNMGVRIGSAKDGKVSFYIPGAAGDDVVADVAGNIYVTEQTLKGVTKYVKR
jgi:hypothetical protein